MHFGECSTKGWYRIKWTLEVDLSSIRDEFHQLMQSWFIKEGAFPSPNSKLSLSDAGTIHLHRTYGDWMQANVGEYHTNWDAHVVDVDNQCEFHMMFSDKDKAMLFKLTFG